MRGIKRSQGRVTSNINFYAYLDVVRSLIYQQFHPPAHIVNMISTYNTTMAATKRIPVSEGVWAEVSELKRPGQTFDDLLSHIVKQEKKRRFIEDMDRIEAEGDFVELNFDVQDSD